MEKESRRKREQLFLTTCQRKSRTHDRQERLSAPHNKRMPPYHVVSDALEADGVGDGVAVGLVGEFHREGAAGDGHGL